MIPYGDDVGGTRRTWVTETLIGIMILVFLAEFLGPWGHELAIAKFAFYDQLLAEHSPSCTYRLFTSEFLHGDVFHIGFNMVYFYAFGRTIEKMLGSWIYLMVFLLLGVPGTLAHYMIDPHSQKALIGASGSISGIMGMYLVLAFRARIRTYMGRFPGFGPIIFQLPAWTILVYFLVLQIVSLVADPSGGIAYDVHVVCFVIGCIAGELFKRTDFVQDNIVDIERHPLRTVL